MMQGADISCLCSPWTRLVITVLRKKTGGVVLEWPGDSFVGAFLAAANLPFAQLFEVDMRAANLRGADLCNADLRGAKLSGATLTGADVTLADLTNADCSGACLGDCRLQAVSKATRGATCTLFRRADCTRATFKNSNLSGCDFTDASMHRADLSRTDLRDAILTGADLSGADLSFSDLTGASLAHSSLVGAILTGCDLTGADLRNADLTLATLNGVRCHGAKFDGSLWSKTVVARASGLHDALGLDDVRYGDPSSVDFWTLQESLDVLPNAWLEHTGVREAGLSLAREPARQPLASSRNTVAAS